MTAMASSIDQNITGGTAKTRAKTPTCEVDTYRGEAVYIYAFDVAYDMSRAPIRELLGQPVAQFAIDVSKRCICRRWSGSAPAALCASSEPSSSSRSAPSA
jgi:hypothetical protein